MRKGKGIQGAQSPPQGSRFLAGAKKSKKVGSSPVQVTTSYLSVPELKSIAQGSGATLKPAAKADVGRRSGGP